MSSLEILTYGAPVLRRRAKAVNRVDDEVRELLEQMVETTRAAPGLGLAAPQVGQSVRAIVVLVEEDEYRLVNPKIIKREGAVEGIEGCLSIPGLQGEVVRPERVTVKALTANSRPVTVPAEGLLARVLCHEIDHLDGILFTDRADPDSLHWIIRDESEEGGFRKEPVSLDEALQALLEKRWPGEDGGSSL